MTRKIYIHLNHPCQEVDVWELGDGDSEEIARKQGYVSLDWLRQVVDENKRLKTENRRLSGAEKWEAMMAARLVNP